jgi:hypothetical protein
VQVNLGVFKELCVELFLKQIEVLKIFTNLYVIMGRKVAELFWNEVYDMNFHHKCQGTFHVPFDLVCSSEKLIFFLQVVEN